VTDVLLDGLGIPESLRWHEDRLWFCNWTVGEIVALDVRGSSEVVTSVPTSVPVSIDWLPGGALLVVSGQEGLLLRQERGGTLATHADLTQFGVVNEIVVAESGNAYVNSDVVVVVSPDATVTRVAEGISWGNGMAITPDGSTLLVAESHAACITAFTIESDATLSDRRVWADLNGDAPDGICVDADGAVWYASVPGRHCVRVREGGEVLQTIDTGDGAFACMLGGPDGRTLFAGTAEWHGMDRIFGAARTGRILATQVDVPHAGRP
jgi:sugar lactone lactonase YvrE